MRPNGPVIPLSRLLKNGWLVGPHSFPLVLFPGPMALAGGTSGPLGRKRATAVFARRNAGDTQFNLSAGHVSIFQRGTFFRQIDVDCLARIRVAVGGAV